MLSIFEGSVFPVYLLVANITFLEISCRGLCISIRIENSVDPDQMASSLICIYSVFKKGYIRFNRATVKVIFQADLLDMHVSHICISYCIIQLFGHCIATRYAMSRSLVKLTEIGTSCGRGKTVTQKPINMLVTPERRQSKTLILSTNVDKNS